VIIQLKRNALCRLQHFVTGKVINHFVNVDKLRSLRDSRDILHQRLATTTGGTTKETTAGNTSLDNITALQTQLIDQPLDLRIKTISPFSFDTDNNETRTSTDVQPSETILTTGDGDCQPLDLSKVPSTATTHKENNDLIKMDSPSENKRKVIKVTAIKPKVPIASYKVHWSDDSPPTWVLAHEVPEELLIAFQLARHQKRLRKQNK
jgi:hypothetical protein